MKFFKYHPVTVLLCLFIISCSTDSETETATFYKLNTFSNPPQGGEVVPETGDYEAGETVVITAIPAEEDEDGFWIFEEWLGVDSDNENPITVTMNSDKNITATFLQVKDWMQKADFEGNGRWHAMGFAIGDKGYVTSGFDGSPALLNDLWEYDPQTDSWSQKADFPGGARLDAVVFTIGDKAYYGTGRLWDAEAQATVSQNDFWEYDPVENRWTQLNVFGGTARHSAVGYSIGNKGYVGTGYDENSSRLRDFWEYDPPTDSWTRISDFPGQGRISAFGISIGDKGYVGKGLAGLYENDFWEYNPQTDQWTQKTDYPGGGSVGNVGFAIGGKIYLGTGDEGSLNPTKDFWEYDPQTDSWTQTADFEGGIRRFAFGFTIDGQGYLGAGHDGHPGNYENDFWEFNPNRQ